MPGRNESMRTSSPRASSPGMSSCGRDWPIIVYWSGVLSTIALSSSGVKVFVALPLLTMSAKDTDFLLALSVTVESRATQVSGLAFRSCAPASISAMRPAAPARHMASKFIRVDQLPPVMIAPSTGSLYFGSLLDERDAHVAPASRRAPRRRAGPWSRRCAGPCRPWRR